MLVAGMLLRNVTSAVDAFPATWGSQMRAAALAIIYLRCGLDLNFEVMRKYKLSAIRLSLIPGLCEAFFDGGLAVAIFGMPVLLGFTLGFVMKGVGPGLVVPAMFRLRSTEPYLGVGKGIPDTVVISASFDDAIAITFFAIFSHLAIHEPGDGEAWSIAEGPLQVVFGIVGGIILGIALGCTKVFRTPLHRMVGSCAASLILRICVTFVTMMGLGYTWRERLFIGFAWTPKATLQAALSAVPLTMINTYYVGTPEYAQYEIWGQEILTTGIFTIVICAPVGVTLIHYFAPLLLSPSRDAAGDEGSVDGYEKSRTSALQEMETGAVAAEGHADSCKFPETRACDTPGNLWPALVY
ncbi:hypothetical protein N2152v2_008986 [Parachlorella kessleri]